MRAAPPFALAACLSGLLFCSLVLPIPAQAAETVTLASSSSGTLIAKEYPLTNLRLSVRVKYSKPGTVLDTIGINAAPNGSFGITIGSDGKPVFLLYDPSQESSVKASNGWHVIAADTAIPANNDAKLSVDVLDRKIVFSVNGKVEKEVEMTAKLSGEPIYFGDNPCDDGWGESYNIHPSMVGEAQVLYIGDVSKAPSEEVVDKGNVIELASPSSTGMLQGSYPTTNLRIALTVNYTKPGVVLDTVGINEAPEGSFVLNINSAGKAVFLVFSPETESEVSLDNGWHVITSESAIPAGTDGKVDVDVREKDIVMRVNGKMEKKVPLAVKLSGKQVYFGDNPEDDSWGEGYNIHPGMVGTVKVRFFDAIPKGEPSPPPAAETPAPPAAGGETPPPPPPPAPEGETKPEPPPAAPPSPGGGEKAPEPPPTDAPTDGLQAVIKALESGDAKTASGAVTPLLRSKYEKIFTEHPEAMKRLAELLKTATAVNVQPSYAEYQFTEKESAHTVALEKSGDRWYIAHL